ncbi:MAG: cbb3-type cytochrome c oxidase subunit 3 [Pseudomonadota bacterium]
MYEALSSFAQTGGLLLFVLAFVLVLIYALSPRRKAEFDKAARMPLDEKLDEKDDAHV